MIKVLPPIRPCDVENLADFSRYYRFAWVGWHGHPEGPQPVNLQAVGDDTITVQDLKGRAHIITWRQAKSDISFGVPDLGMVNTPATIIYMHRRAPREAHKGYRPAGINHTIFNGWELWQVVGRLDPNDRDIIRSLFYPEYYTRDEAVDALRNGERVGCALSPLLGLFTTKSWKYPGIAYRRHTVGHLEEYRTAVIPKMYADSIPTIREKLGVEVVIK